MKVKDKIKKLRTASVITAISLSSATPLKADIKKTDKVNADVSWSPVAKEFEYKKNYELAFQNSFDFIASEFEQFNLTKVQKKEIVLIMLIDNLNKNKGLEIISDLNNEENSFVKIWGEYKQLMSDYDKDHEEVVEELCKRNIPKYPASYIRRMALSYGLLRVATEGYYAKAEDKVASVGSVGIDNRKSRKYYKMQYYKSKKGRSCVLNVGNGDYLMGLVKCLKAYNQQKKNMLNKSQISGR